VLLVPLLWVLHVPLLAAVVPGAILTLVSLDVLDGSNGQTALPAMDVIEAGDTIELARVAHATWIPSHSERLS